MIKMLRKFFKASPPAPPPPSPSEKEQVFDEILRVSERTQRAERLKQFGKENDISVGVSGSDAYIALKNEQHDALMKRYIKLAEEEGE